MRFLRTPLAIAVLFTGTTLGSAGDAWADDVQACLSAYEMGQKLRAQAKLRAARTALLQCARGCDPELAADCDKWRIQVEDSLPSIVVDARDGDGKEVVDVQVRSGTEQLAATLDGTAIPIDPGSHTLRFERSGSPAVEQQVVIRVGERNRPIQVRFAPPRPVAGLPAKPDVLPPLARPVPLAVWPLGALGVASAGVFAYFAVRGLSLEGELAPDACKPTCGEEYGRVQTHYAVADVALSVSLVSFAAATLVYLTRPSIPAPKVARSPIHLGVTPSGASIRAAF